MSRSRSPKRGDVYWIDPNPVVGREIQNRHRFVVITPGLINKLGTAITVPITSGGLAARGNGLTVAISGHDTTGVALCHQVRSFDIESRVKASTARYIETLDNVTINEILNKVVSIIDADED